MYASHHATAYTNASIVTATERGSFTNYHDNLIFSAFHYALNGRRDWIKSEYKLSFSNLSFICYIDEAARSSAMRQEGSQRGILDMSMWSGNIFCIRLNFAVNVTDLFLANCYFYFLSHHMLYRRGSSVICDAAGGKPMQRALEVILTAAVIS